MSPDLFVVDSPELRSTVREALSVKSGAQFGETLRSPKINRNQRLPIRRRHNVEGRYKKLVEDVPPDDVVESTPEPAWRKPLKVVQQQQTTTPARKRGKRRRLQNHTLTQMYPQDSKSPDATLIESPAIVQDEDCDFVSYLLKRSDSLMSSPALQKLSQKADLHDRTTQPMSQDAPPFDDKRKENDVQKSLQAKVDEEYNRRRMRKDFEEYVEKCDRKPKHHVFATDNEVEERSPQVYHKTFTGFWDMDFPANETRNNNESTLFY